jgi:Na+-driven multidrug efflux pump
LARYHQPGAFFIFPNVYDTAWLGRVDRDAQAAAGLAMSARVTTLSVLMALSVASEAVVARYLGTKDQNLADLAALQATLMGLRFRQE